MEGRKEIFCYVVKGGELVRDTNGEATYIGGLSKGLKIHEGMSYEEFVIRACDRCKISKEGTKFYYTLKYNCKMFQELEDDSDVSELVMHSEEPANVYIVHTASHEGGQIAAIDRERAMCCTGNVSHTSIASCDATCFSSMHSRGFGSTSTDYENMSLESERFRDAILGSGHTFKNAEEFRNAIYLMSLGGRFQYKYEKNSPKHMSVKCSVNGCKWKITAHAVYGNSILRVHTYNVQHNHSAQDECSSQIGLSSKRGATIIEQVLRSTPSYLPRQIVKDFSREHGIKLSYSQAWRFKEKAKEFIHGSPQDSYKLLPWLCEKLKEINPGTIAEYTCLDDHFLQLFVAYGFSIQGFMMGCRPLLVVDSSHLSGPYKGALLSAIAYDADDRMFPVAFGVVSSENYEDWYWFLHKLKVIIGDKEVVIISDRHQALLRSVPELFGIENHAYCYCHLKENFSTHLSRHLARGKKGKDDGMMLLDAIAYASDCYSNYTILSH